MPVIPLALSLASSLPPLNSSLALSISPPVVVAMFTPILSLISLVFSLPNSLSLSLYPTRQPSSIDAFIASESPVALAGLLANIGPTGQKCEGAASGVVIASPSLTDPDYDYTWIRDASLVNKLLIDRYTQGRDSALGGTIDSWIQGMAAIQQVSNPSGTVSNGGLGEPKFMPDGSAFTGSWGRPQRDGPALRATAIMTYADHLIAQGNASYVSSTLWPVLTLDLDYVANNWNATGFDLWEELSGSSFFTTSAQHRALFHGAAFASTMSDPARAALYSAQASNALCFLQSFWSPSQNYAVANINLASSRSGLDANTLLASVHAFDPLAGCDSATFQPCSDKALANHYAVVNSFRSLYGINGKYAAGQAVAIGRYQEDVYYNGNPWYLATLAAAEQLYSALTTWSTQSSLSITALSQPFFAQLVPGVAVGTYAAGSATYESVTQAVRAYADGFVGVVQAYVGEDGALAEQFDRNTGVPTSAADLTWSYAAFLTMADARAGLVPASWGAAGAVVPDGTCQAGPQPAMVQVEFLEYATTVYGEEIYITGSLDQLADWSTSNAFELTATNYPTWSITLPIPAGSTFQYKFIRVNNGQVTWESDPNRQFTAPASGTATVSTSWR